MGWFWSSSPSLSAEKPTSSSELTFPPPPPPRPQSESQIEAPSTSASHPPQTDKDVESFLASFEANETPTNTYTRTKTASQPAPQETPTHYAPTGTTDPSAPKDVVDLDTLDISPKALYPRSMSCRQAFDQAFYCQSLGGKFNDIYRFGGIKSCSQQWGAFWFCMRVKNLGDNERGHAIAEWYEQRELNTKKERGGSSEDVWEIRTEPVKRAFGKNLDETSQTWKGEVEPDLERRG